MAKSGKFYPRVPKSLRANLRYRHEIVRDASRDPAKAEVLVQACTDDALFFFNTFLWMFDPRLRGEKRVPFITYPYQDDSILTIDDAIERGYPVNIEKSRDMGATWIVLGVFLKRFLFHDYCNFLCGSRNDDYVDLAGNEKALFQKLDFACERLPSFLLRGYDLANKLHRTIAHMEHPLTHSKIDGEATTPDFARGDRRTAILWDEVAACKGRIGPSIVAACNDVTNCLIANSTHGVGTGGQTFAALCANPDIKRIRQLWWQHPEKAKGLYRDADGNPRSPWYDDRCKKAISRQEIAREVDCNPSGAAGAFFELAEIERLKKSARLPDHMGELIFSPQFDQARSFTSDWQAGRFRIWFPLTPDCSVPQHRYVIGADVSQGTGASNSVAAAWDRLTAERVAEFVTARVKPDNFAEYLFGMGTWLGYGGTPALIVVERNGPGEVVVKRLQELGYKQLYFDIKNEGSLKQEVSDRPGWHSTDEKKLMVFSTYRNLLYGGQLTNPSFEALDECTSIVFDKDGYPEHQRHSALVDDHSDAKANHADRVTADALAAKILALCPPQKLDEKTEFQKPDLSLAPRYSLAGRRRVATQRTASAGWAWK